VESRLQALRDALRGARLGDFSIRLAEDARDEVDVAEVVQEINALFAQQEQLVRELDRVARMVAVEGKTFARTSLAPATGAWAVAAGAVDLLIERMAWPVTATTSVLELVAAGDLSGEFPLHIAGTPLQGAFERLGTIR